MKKALWRGPALLLLAMTATASFAQEGVKIVSHDDQIDAVDPGIKLFVREKMADRNARGRETDSAALKRTRGRASRKLAPRIELPYRAGAGSRSSLPWCGRLTLEYTP